MKYYYNIYTHKNGKLKGDVDDEYYAKDEETKRVLCLYISRNRDGSTELVYFNNKWVFEKEISRGEFLKSFITSIFKTEPSGVTYKEILNFLFNNH